MEASDSRRPGGDEWVLDASSEVGAASAHYGDRLSGYLGGLLGAEERYQGSHLLRPAHPSQRNVRRYAGGHVFDAKAPFVGEPGPIGAIALGEDGPRENVVDGDAFTL